MAQTPYDYDDMWEPNLLIPGKIPVGRVNSPDWDDCWIIGKGLRTIRGKYPLTLSNVGIESGPQGPLLVSTASTGKAANSSYAKAVYGIVLHFRLSVTELLSSETPVIVIKLTNTISISAGSCTGLLTDETLTLFDSGDTKRTGIGETITTGNHVLALVWNGSEYVIGLDGRIPTQLTAAAGPSGLVTADRIEIYGRKFSSDSRFDTYSLQLLTQPIAIGADKLSLDPYHFLLAA